MAYKLEKVNKSYGMRTIFDGLDFDLSQCGFYLVCSPSGGGKTTLLNILAGYENIDSGKRDIDSSTNIATIFQSYELIDELNVQENILMSNRISGYENKNLYQMLIDILGLEILMNHYPNELSLGQRQRVGIARALLKNPEIILCDEPTESLDNENKERVMNLLKTIASDRIIIVASHEEDIVENYYDYKYSIQDGKLIKVDERNSHKNIAIKYKYQSQKADKKEIKRYVHKIWRKKTLLLHFFMTLLLLFQVGLFQLTQSLFEGKEEVYALNRNTFYIKSDDQNSLKKYIGKESLPILNFDNPEINGRRIRAYIYPIKNADVQSNQIMINQNTALLLQDIWECDENGLYNREITLYYQLEERTYPIKMTIQSIIQEDVSVSQIYYSYENMNTFLQSKEFRNQMTQYDYFIENASEYAITCPDTELKSFYQKVVQDSSITVYHSIFSMIDDKSNQKQLYSLVFTIVQIILMIVSLFYMLYYAFKDTEKNMKTLSILYSAGAPIDCLRKMYFQEKCYYLILFHWILFIEIILYCLMKHTSIDNILLMIGYVFAYSVIYLICLWIALQHFDNHKISKILKRGKDE